MSPKSYSRKRGNANSVSSGGVIALDQKSIDDYVGAAGRSLRKSYTDLVNTYNAVINYAYSIIAGSQKRGDTPQVMPRNDLGGEVKGDKGFADRLYKGFVNSSVGKRFGNFLEKIGYNRPKIDGVECQVRDDLGDRTMGATIWGYGKRILAVGKDYISRLTGSKSAKNELAAHELFHLGNPNAPEKEAHRVVKEFYASESQNPNLRVEERTNAVYSSRMAAAGEKMYNKAA